MESVVMAREIRLSVKSNVLQMDVIVAAGGRGWGTGWGGVELTLPSHTSLVPRRSLSHPGFVPGAKVKMETQACFRENLALLVLSRYSCASPSALFPLHPSPYLPQARHTVNAH